MATFWEIAARSVGHMFSLSFVYLYFLFISHFDFKSGIWLLIAPVPVHCFSIITTISIFAKIGDFRGDNLTRRKLRNILI